MKNSKPEIREYKGYKVVKIKDVKGFSKWLSGQTMPVIEEYEDPFGWAFYEDYDRFIKGLKVID